MRRKHDSNLNTEAAVSLFQALKGFLRGAEGSQVAGPQTLRRQTSAVHSLKESRFNCINGHYYETLNTSKAAPATLHFLNQLKWNFGSEYIPLGTCVHGL